MEKTNPLLYLMGFFNGLAVCVFLYCIIFLGRINLYGFLLIPFLGFGLITYIPYYFIIQLIVTHLFALKNNSVRFLFLGGITLFIFTTIFFNYKYKEGIKSIESFKKSNFKKLDKTFMTEKLLGMYFKYHTKFCEYDGWRPPLHEPALIIGQWINGDADPLGVDLKTRIILYKKFFPNKPIKLKCSCAIQYNETYHNDKLLKEFE